MTIREDILGIDHVDTAKSYNNIGNIYAVKGMHDEAMMYY